LVRRLIYIKMTRECEGHIIDEIGNSKKCIFLSENNYCDFHIEKYRFRFGDSTCAICLSEIDKSKEVPLECGHWFHLGCLAKGRISRCPCCREYLTIKEKEWVCRREIIVYGMLQDCSHIMDYFANYCKISSLLCDRELLDPKTAIKIIDLTFDLQKICEKIPLPNTVEKSIESLCNIAEDEEKMKILTDTFY
jgi:hypothetical protein